MRTIADHLFDILENSVNACADKIEIRLSYNRDIFYCQIIDNGIPAKLDNITDPFVTSRTTRRVGLGLPLLKATAESTGGTLTISLPGKKKGTKLEFSVNMKHIDARPFGDLAAVFSDILRSWPAVDFTVIVTRSNHEEKILDTAELKRALNTTSLEDQEILNYVKENVREALYKIGIDQHFGIV